MRPAEAAGPGGRRSGDRAAAPATTLALALAAALTLGAALGAATSPAEVSAQPTAATQVGIDGIDQPPDGAQSELAETVTRSVGLVRSAGGTGSGWIVGPDTVITNLHVARAGSGDIYVDLSDGERVECWTAVGDRDMDLAVLRCDTAGRPALPIDEAVPAAGTSVVVTGYPGGRGPLTTMGEITGERRVVRDIPTIGFTAAIEPGSSGSPVVDDQGAVRAVATFGGGLGVPIAELVPLVEVAEGYPTTKAAAEWQLRLRRSGMVGLPVLLIGLLVARRRGRPRPARSALGWTTVALIVTLGLTQVQFAFSGPAHFL